jgi:parallel beta-helix repeat protein
VALAAALATLAASSVIGVGLTGTAEAARRSCPANSSTDLYVNPVVNRSARVVPTGVSAPAECAFASITDAIESAEARGLGSGARIILTGATASTPAVFRQEAFPLAIPVDMTLTTTDDPALGGAGLDPSRYVVQFTGRAAYAADLEGGRLAGVTFKNERATRATIMLICDTGTTAIESVTFDGAGTSGGAVGKGLQLWPGCDLDASALRVRGFSGNGVIVEEGADLTLVSSKIHNNGGDGLTIRGVTAISNSEFAFNGDDGILVERSTSSSFHSNIVRDNTNNGFEVHKSNASFTSNKIFSNSRSAGWDQPQLLFVGRSDPYGIPYWTGSQYVLAYPFGPADKDCDDLDVNPNQVHSYNTANDPVGSSEGSVGLYASQGAYVWADNNMWRTGDEAQNADQDASSFVDADTLCPAGGILLQTAPFPGPPVE